MKDHYHKTLFKIKNIIIASTVIIYVLPSFTTVASSNTNEIGENYELPKALQNKPDAEKSPAQSQDNHNINQHNTETPKHQEQVTENRAQEAAHNPSATPHKGSFLGSYGVFVLLLSMLLILIFVLS